VRRDEKQETNQDRTTDVRAPLHGKLGTEIKLDLPFEDLHRLESKVKRLALLEATRPRLERTKAGISHKFFFLPLILMNPISSVTLLFNFNCFRIGL
jgi:hypothetical protein